MEYEKFLVVVDYICGLWIVGFFGCGKIILVRKEYGDLLFIKGLNKWFDGYCGEYVVLLDDLEFSIA